MCRTSSVNLENQPTLGSFLFSLQPTEENPDCNKPSLANNDDSWIEQITFLEERAVSNEYNDLNCNDVLISENVSVDSNEKNATNEGRWTFEEHSCFLEGLRTYGKSWRKLSTMIPTRTVLQIRTHAQKYMLKLLRAKQKHLTLDKIVYSDFEILNSKSNTNNKRKVSTEDDWDNLISTLGNCPSNFYQPYLNETCPEISIKKQKSDLSFTVPYEAHQYHSDYQNIPNMGGCSPSSVASALLDQHVNYYQELVTNPPTCFQQTSPDDIERTTSPQHYEVYHSKTGLILQYLPDDTLDALLSFPTFQHQDLQLFDFDFDVSVVATMIEDHQEQPLQILNHPFAEIQPIIHPLCYTQQNRSF